MSQLNDSSEWQRLQTLSKKVPNLKVEFSADKDRVNKFSVDAGEWHADYSKQLVNAEIMETLLELARVREVLPARDKMFAGEHINSVEDRSVLHVALRAPEDSKYGVNEGDIGSEIHAELAKMKKFSDRIRTGEWSGQTGVSIKNIINIGIGGSDLGPVMVTEALKPYSDTNITIRYISNIDPTDFYLKTHDLDPAETLFIIASKTFTTLETMTNAESAKGWLESALGEGAAAKHMVALSTNIEAVKSFGIDEANIFKFWDWVGGRYSLWSAIGLSIMVAIGSDNFDQLLAGAHAIDEHFLSAEPSQNLPIVLGLIGIWNRNFLGSSTEAVLPYSQYLHRLPAYLQQAVMESNGKSVTLFGEPVRVATSPVIWGEPGTNGQHAFMQMIHQGTDVVPVDFIGFKEPNHPIGDHHQKLMANMIAQGEALAIGKTAEELGADGVEAKLIAHKIMPGNRPSTTFIAPKLTPKSLGQLIAIYEHKIFVQGVIWGINSFDQWGVELGKHLANDILSKSNKTHDSSTQELLDRTSK